MLPLITLLALGGAQVALSAPAPVEIKPRATTITVDLSQTYQTMDGFGFSEAFGRASNLYNLPATQRSHALDLLFSTTVGAGFTILRNRIGSGGSGDSIEPTSPGSPSAIPKYTWDGSEGYQVWLSQQAKTYGVTRFYANAWSAPGFMKTNGVETNGGYLCGVSGETCSSGDWKQAYANFLVQYIKDYASSGIAITHLGFLNEPDYVTSYSSMQSSGTQAADFIKVLYPTLQSAGLSSVGITCCDMVGWNDQVTATAQLISAGVENMISRITSHGYSSDPTSPMKTTRPTWMTEKETTDAWNANWYSSGSASEGFTWAQSIYTAVVNANVSAYFYWEGIEQTTNNAGLIQISGTTVNPSARLWAYAQWSRSVRPGAVRVGTSGAPSGILSGAFKNPDGSVSVQILNTGTADQSLSISTKGFTAQSVKAYITNQSNNGVVSFTASLTGGTISATVPGKSMMTFILTGGSSGGGQVSSSTAVTSPTSSHSTSKTPTTSTSAPTPTSTKTAAHYDQCGGSGFTGPTVCAAPYTCQYTNDFYSQCL